MKSPRDPLPARLDESAEPLRLGESAEPLPPSDADLIAACRAGDAAAYDTLYRRHVTAAHGLARQLVRNRAEADDVVAETFAKILDLLHRGGGPDDAFRPYLLTAIPRAAARPVPTDRWPRTPLPPVTCRCWWRPTSRPATRPPSRWTRPTRACLFPSAVCWRARWFGSTW